MSNTSDLDNHADNAANGARDVIGNVVREAKKMNASLMDGAKLRTDKVATLVEKEGRVALSNLQHVVKEKPAMAVGVAVGAGLLLGLLFAPRR